MTFFFTLQTILINFMITPCKMRHILSVFDFDHTIVHRNSDVVLRNLLPKSVLESEKLKELRPSWTAYMGEVFRLLPEHGIDRSQVETACKTLEHTEGMKELLAYLKSIESDVIILSDANSEIIHTWLKYNHPSESFYVFTNPAKWEDGILRVEPYEEQNKCELCSKNMCKGSILLKFLETRNYETVLYTGDGKNDLCPSRKLKSTDYVFPRIGYALEKLLGTEIEAFVSPWKSATEIKALLETF